MLIADPLLQIWDSFLFNNLWNFMSVSMETAHFVILAVASSSFTFKWQWLELADRNRSLQSSDADIFFNLNWFDVQFFIATFGGKSVIKCHDSTGECNHSWLCPHNAGSFTTISSSDIPGGIFVRTSAIKRQPVVLFLLVWLKKWTDSCGVQLMDKRCRAIFEIT